MKACCGDSNKYTKHTMSNIKRKSPELIANKIMSAAMDFCKGSKNEFEIAVVSEPSVFERVISDKIFIYKFSKNVRSKLYHTENS